MVEFQDDWETVSPSAGTGTRLLRQELDNHSKGLPPGLTAMPSSRGSASVITAVNLIVTAIITGTHLPRQELDNHGKGLLPGVTAMLLSGVLAGCHVCDNLLVLQNHYSCVGEVILRQLHVMLQKYSWRHCEVHCTGSWQVLS